MCLCSEPINFTLSFVLSLIISLDSFGENEQSEGVEVRNSPIGVGDPVKPKYSIGCIRDS